MEPGTLVRLTDGKVGVIGPRRPSPNPAMPMYEVYFRRGRLVASNIAEILAPPPETYPHGNGTHLYANVTDYVKDTDERVSPGT